LPSLYINPRLEQPLLSFKSHAFWKNLKQDDFKALKFFQKACDLNFSGGCSNLGFMYKEGKGVRKSNTKALKYYGKACDLELKSSCLTPLPSLYINPRIEQPLPEFKPHAFWKNLFEFWRWLL
jgi:TPR repeat protein